jgi:hypothetical protein
VAGYRPAMRTADYVIYSVLICVWTLPWAVLSAAMVLSWLAPALFNPLSGFWSWVFGLYVLDWLAVTLMLLLAGLSIATAGRGCLWLVAWTATVAGGFAFQFKTLLLASRVFGQQVPAGHGTWESLAWGRHAPHGLTACRAGDRAQIPRYETVTKYLNRKFRL